MHLIYRCLTLAALSGMLLASHPPAHADSLVLPPAGFLAQTLDQVLHPEEYHTHGVRVTLGVAGAGDTDIRSLLTLTSKNQPPDQQTATSITI